MGSRYGRGNEPAARPQRISPEAEERLRQSDARYVEEMRRRERDQTIRFWITRLAVIVVLLAVMRLWGIDFLNSVLFKGKTAAYHAQQAGESVRSRIDERTGANIDTNP